MLYTHLTKTQAQAKIEQVIEAFHRTAHQETLWHCWPGSRTIAQSILEQLPVAWAPEPICRGHKVTITPTNTPGIVEFVEPNEQYVWVKTQHGIQRFHTSEVQQ